MSELHSALLAPGDKQALLDALALGAGITIPTASKAVVTAHLMVAAEMAQLVFAAEPVADFAASAAIYVPPVNPAAGGTR